MKEVAISVLKQITDRTLSGIYEIRHIASGKKYVGSASSLYFRWSVHISELTKGTHHSTPLQNAWNKYGADAFEWRVIEVTERDRDVLLEREQYWIDTFQVADGRSGYNVCPQAKSVLGITRKQSTKDKISASHMGIRPSEETRLKLSAAKKGRKLTEKHKENLRVARRFVFLGHNKGKVMSQEQKDKIRATCIAVSAPTEVRRQRSLDAIARKKANQGCSNQLDLFIPE